MHRFWVGAACGLIALGLLGLRDTAAVAQDKQQVVWIVRHAEKQKETKPDEDVPLTAEGEKRAELLAETLSGENIEVIITSLKLRTMQTAAPLEKRLKAQPGNDLGVFRFKNVSEVVSKVKSVKGNVLIAHHSENLSGIVKGLRKKSLAQKVCGYDRLYKLNMGANPPVLEASLYGERSKECKPLAKIQ